MQRLMNIKTKKKTIIFKAIIGYALKDEFCIHMPYVNYKNETLLTYLKRQALYTSGSKHNSV